MKQKAKMSRCGFAAFSLAILVACSLMTSKAQSVTNAINRAWGKTVDGISVSIIPSKTVISKEESITLSVLVKYDGDATQPEIIVNHMFVNGYDLKVLQPDGTPAPLTPRGKQLVESSKSITAIDAITLKPGGEDSFAIPFSNWGNAIFDLSSSGKYKVLVTMRLVKIQSPAKETRVPSNEVEFTVSANK